MGSRSNKRVGASCNARKLNVIKQLLSCCGVDFNELVFYEDEIDSISKDYSPDIIGDFKSSKIKMNELYCLANELCSNTYIYYEFEEGNTVSDYSHRREEIYDPKQNKIFISETEFCYGECEVLGKNIYELVKNECEAEARENHVKIEWEEDDLYPIGDAFFEICENVIERHGGYKGLGTKQSKRTIKPVTVSKEKLQIIADRAGERGYKELITLLKKKKNIVPVKIIEMIEENNDTGFVIEGSVLKEYHGDESDVTIPDGVFRIGEFAFHACRQLEKITIPPNVKYIDKYAFNSCNNLKQVIMPNEMDKIDSFAFCKCISLSKIVIPHGVMEIKEATFLECKNLESVVLPDGLTVIGPAAFSYCDKLQEINIPQTVKLINNFAFDHCVSLVNLEITQSDIVFGENVFCDCKKLIDKKRFRNNTVD